MSQGTEQDHERRPQMRLRDASHYLGVTQDTIRRWITKGKLTASINEERLTTVDSYEVAMMVRDLLDFTTIPDKPMRVRFAARHLGVGDDNIRRMIAKGMLTAPLDRHGRTLVDAGDVERLRRQRIGTFDTSVNRLIGIVTDLQEEEFSDGILVEMQCGPHRVVSRVEQATIDYLDLEIGSVTTAVIKPSAIELALPERRLL